MRRKASGPSKFEWCYMMLLLVVFASLPFIVGGQETTLGSLNSFQGREHMALGGDQLKQTIATILYAGCAFLLVSHLPPRALLLLGYPLLFLLLWSYASIVWSSDPDVSFRRCLALTGTVIVGLYLGLRFDQRRMLRLLTYSATIVLVASLALSVIAPLYGNDPEGRLRGVFVHKNAIGSFSAATLIVVIGRFLDRRSLGKRATIGTVMLGCTAVLCMALATSASVVPVLLSALAALLAIRLIQRSNIGALIFSPILLCVAIAAGAAILGSWDSLIELLGKDPNISGRTLVWDFVFRMIAEKPFLGYGFQSFWEGNESPGAVFWKTTYLGVPHAHNGFLQLTLDTGGVGLLLFLAAAFRVTANLFGLLRETQGRSWFQDQFWFIGWAIIYLVFYLVTNLDESWLWIGNELPPALFIYVAVRSNIMVMQLASTRRASPSPALRAREFARQPGKEN